VDSNPPGVRLHAPCIGSRNQTYLEFPLRGLRTLRRWPATRRLDKVCWMAWTGLSARPGSSFGVGRGCGILWPKLPLSQDSMHPLCGRLTDLSELGRPNSPFDPPQPAPGRASRRPTKTQPGRLPGPLPIRTLAWSLTSRGGGGGVTRDSEGLGDPPLFRGASWARYCGPNQGIGACVISHGKLHLPCVSYVTRSPFRFPSPVSFSTRAETRVRPLRALAT